MVGSEKLQPINQPLVLLSILLFMAAQRQTLWLLVQLQMGLSMERFDLSH